MATMALRTICVAYRDLDGSEDLSIQDNKIFKVESEKLTFLAILGI
jgi:Ca2+ transporting ATPase